MARVPTWTELRLSAKKLAEIQKECYRSVHNLLDSAIPELDRKLDIIKFNGEQQNVNMLTMRRSPSIQELRHRNPYIDRPQNYQQPMKHQEHVQEHMNTGYSYYQQPIKSQEHVQEFGNSRASFNQQSPKDQIQERIVKPISRYQQPIEPQEDIQEHMDAQNSYYQPPLESQEHILEQVDEENTYYQQSIEPQNLVHKETHREVPYYHEIDEMDQVPELSSHDNSAFQIPSSKSVPSLVENHAPIPSSTTYINLNQQQLRKKTEHKKRSTKAKEPENDAIELMKLKEQALPVPLSEFLMRNRPEIVMRAECRTMYIKKRKYERRKHSASSRIVNAFQRIKLSPRKNVMQKARRSFKDYATPDYQVETKLSEFEMKRLTARVYRRLPEVVRRKRDEVTNYMKVQNYKNKMEYGRKLLENRRQGIINYPLRLNCDEKSIDSGHDDSLSSGYGQAADALRADPYY